MFTSNYLNQRSFIKSDTRTIVSGINVMKLFIFYNIDKRVIIVIQNTNKL